MKRFILATAVAIIVMTGLAGAVQNAGAAWNAFAATYQFGTYPQPSGVTFAQDYEGSNFSADFAGILNQVGKAMKEANNPVGDELLNATLENWPDAGL